ncbi:MAG: hypothetical protein E6K97_02300 [Thaumarchaeota archaeon]|nr:MAG: hypothetical protein E6K97_02300 [Nitrososphaerota archaeon]
MTKLDDLRSYLKNKNKKKDDNIDDSARKNLAEKEGKTFSLEVAGSDATANPLTSFGTEETDPDIIDQLYSCPRNRVPKGEGASYWDQD